MAQFKVSLARTGEFSRRQESAGFCDVTTAIVAPVTPQTRTRFAVIEDHPAIVEALVAESARHDDLEFVQSFVSIESVSRLIRAQAGETFDVIVLDLELDGLAGLKGISEVAKWGPRVVVYSQLSAHATVRDAHRAGATAYVTKGMGSATVMDAIRSASRGQQRDWVINAPVDVSFPPQAERLLRHLSVETNSERLAVRMSLSTRTIDNMVSNLYDELKLVGTQRTRAAIQDWARKHGYLEN